MRIATWNVNSVRTRLTHLTTWLTANPVEVVCLQETKVIDADFPRQSLEDLGYYVYPSGQKAYNGVALLSRQPLDAVHVGFGALLPAGRVGDLDDQKRLIRGVWGSRQVLNVYIPNGSAVDSEKYAYKLAWLTALRDYLDALLTQTPDVALCLCGDFNIAPDDRDIHDPVGKDAHIMASPLERQALQQIMRLGLRDGFRQFTAEAGHYTWWDYRAAAFRRNQGWRIDHHYLTPALATQAQKCWIDRTPRSWPQPSDHAPVLLELAQG